MPWVKTRPIKIRLHADIAYLKAYHKDAKKIKTIHQTLHSTRSFIYWNINNVVSDIAECPTKFPLALPKPNASTVALNIFLGDQLHNGWIITRLCQHHHLMMEKKTNLWNFGFKSTTMWLITWWHLLAIPCCNTFKSYSTIDNSKSLKL
jgi:hypothetical protein